MHGYLGEQYFARNLLAEAGEHYRKAFSIYPDHPDLLDDMGALLAREGKTKEAIDYFQRALLLGVNDPALARTNLALTLQAQGNLKGAIEQFDRVIQENPLSSAAHFNKGNALYLAGQIKDAIGEYSRALEIDPLNMEAKKNMTIAVQNSTPPAPFRDANTR
jgi:tetratricopeptide (TPR) repeat protein